MGINVLNELRIDNAASNLKIKQSILFPLFHFYFSDRLLYNVYIYICKRSLFIAWTFSLARHLHPGTASFAAIPISLPISSTHWLKDLNTQAVRTGTLSLIMSLLFLLSFSKYYSFTLQSTFTPGSHVA